MSQDFDSIAKGAAQAKGPEAAPAFDPATQGVVYDCYSYDEEVFHEGDEADALSGCEPGDAYWLGVSRSLSHSDFVRVDSIIDDMQVRAADLVGEMADDYLGYLTPEQVHSLEEAIGQWFAAHVPGPSFYAVENVVRRLAPGEDRGAA